MASQTEIFFEIDGQIVRTLPDAWQNIKVVSRWDGSNQEQEVSIDNLVFKGDDAKVVFDQLGQGGLGAFVGIPIKMFVRDIDPNGNPSVLQVFDGMIDLSKNPQFTSCDEVEVSILKKESVDWLTERANAFSFKWLEKEELKITNDDLIPIPYLRNYLSDAATLIALYISAFVMLKELYEAIKALVVTISDIVEAATPSVGAGVTIDLGAIIKVVLIVLAQIAYIAAIIYAIVELAKLIIEETIPPLRYKKGIKLRTLFEKGAEQLDLTFSSTIFDNPIIDSWVVLPASSEKGSKQKINNLSGTPTQGSPIYTFADLIQVGMNMFNAEFRIRAGQLQLERWDKFRTFSNYVVPNVYDDQERKLTQYRINSNELKGEYLVAFQTDLQDQNTLDNFRGVNYDVITQVKNNPLGQKFETTKGLQEIRIPFALGNRKESLTDIEKFVKDLAGIIDGLTGFFGNGTNYQGRIDRRKGSLLLSDHFTSVPKLISMTGGNINANQREYISAKFLYDNFHFINSFVPTADPETGQLKHNQHKLHEDVTVPFCKENFVDLLNNNNASLTSGKECEIEVVEWTPARGIATLTYRVNEQYDFNLKQTKFEPN